MKNIKTISINYQLNLKTNFEENTHQLKEGNMYIYIYTHLKDFCAIFKFWEQILKS